MLKTLNANILIAALALTSGLTNGTEIIPRTKAYTVQVPEQGSPDVMLEAPPQPPTSLGEFIKPKKGECKPIPLEKKQAPQDPHANLGQPLPDSRSLVKRSKPPEDALTQELEGTPNQEREKKKQQYIKACENELGPLPKSAKAVDKRIPITVRLNGRPVVLDPKTKKPAYKTKEGLEPVESKFLEPSGNKLKTCDNPSLAFFGTACALGEDNQLVTLKSHDKNVHWVGITRPDEHPMEGTIGSSMSIIGFNSKTGAACFFPGHISEETGVRFGSPHTDNCLRCHTQSDPFVVTPNLKEAWEQTGIPRRMGANKQGEYNYHVPGLGASGLSHVGERLEIRNPDGSENTTCTACHEVRTSKNIQPVLLDAIGHPLIEKTHRKPYMPPDPTDDAEETHARKVIAEYLRNGKSPHVKSSPIGDCKTLKPGDLPEISVARAKRVSKNKVSVRWKWKENSSIKKENVRFRVSAVPHFQDPCATTMPSPLQEGETLSWATNGSPANGRFEFSHTTDPSVIKRLEYFITPYWRDPKHPECGWQSGFSFPTTLEEKSEGQEKPTPKPKKSTHEYST